MKFEKFLKRVGSRGMLLTECLEKWICDGNVAMIVPAGINVAYSKISEMPVEISEAVDNTPIPENYGADLVQARLNPDGKAKDIKRIYEDTSGDRIAISNADWSLIETDDATAIMYDPNDNETVIGLIVYSDFGDDREVVGVIFAEDFNIYTKIREENNNGN